MAVNIFNYTRIKKLLDEKDVQLIAVSKTKSVAEIQELYDLGQRDFGENYVQELLEKYELLPKDIRWHFIGHLQTNKVKYITPFISIIHGIDSEKLLMEINKQAGKFKRNITGLLQVFISRDETKFGFDENELTHIVQKFRNDHSFCENVKLSGLMGMATFTEDNELITSEFKRLKVIFDRTADEMNELKHPFKLLSMGMSADFTFAVEAGSKMVRIGSLLFGERQSKP